MNITVLAGGIGAARFLAGLCDVVPPESITAICNVGDDLKWHGLHVSPDIDSVIYTLAGIEGEHGWGVRGDTHATLEGLRSLGLDEWFTIGDRDLATHLLRTEHLNEGTTLSEATAAVAVARGLRLRILPVTDDPHPTVVRTAEGDLAFQDYFVRRRAAVPVLGFMFPGAAQVRPAAGVIEAIRYADVLVMAPSNPFVSIGPLLEVPGVRDALATSSARRVAVSPIIGGAAVKGPAAEMMAALGHEVSALGVARLYAGLVDLFVLDAIDEALLPDVRALGMDAVAFDTMMTGDAGRARVARAVIEAAS
ncbi:MAG: 2-phospho-L-lactate transferase [Chloroflexi bacterium]|nr:2-phospho-L-lactate transferase [Chloroflexota bacterium]MDA1239870.1 2-phospho-L-lactate transferase [Chloroflexota bacterium]